jgi:hypothetical protein
LDGNFYMALPTTIAPMCGPGGGPDVADSDLLMVRFDDNWAFDPATDVWTMSDCPEVERYVSGLDYADGYFYVAHHATPRTWTCQQGGPSPGHPPGEVVWLKVFDRDGRPVDAVRVSGDEFGNHPTVEVVGDLVYVAYAHKETQEATENVVVAIYQKVPREESYQSQFCSEGDAVTPTPTPTVAVVIPIGGVNPADPLVKPLLGVISGPIQPSRSPIRDLTDHLRDIGVTSIRNND